MLTYTTKICPGMSGEAGYAFQSGRHRENLHERTNPRRNLHRAVRSEPKGQTDYVQA